MDRLHTVADRFLYLTEVQELPSNIREHVPLEDILFGSSKLYSDLSFARNVISQKSNREVSSELKVRVKFDDSEKKVPKEYREWNDHRLVPLPFGVFDKYGRKIEYTIYGNERWFEEHPIEPGTQAAIKPDPSEILNPSVIIDLFKGRLTI